MAYHNLVEGVRTVFNSGRTQSVEWRKKQLKGIYLMLDEQKDALCEALARDLHKPEVESTMMEIGFARSEAVHHVNHIDAWTKPQKVQKDIMHVGVDCHIRNEPLGVVLIMGAWNYPVQLTIHPMIGAISAGNCVVLKPSELSAHTAALLEKLLPRYIDPEAVKVVNGAVHETTELLKERFDHILYTGNSAVAKIVMAAAAKHLTPTTLELGGKSPCYVDDSSDLRVAARRITWGKFVNCGQTCIAPDYVLCTRDVQDKLVPLMKETLEEYYGTNPRESKSYGRIVNARHFQRVKGLVTPSKVALGGDMDEKENFIAPTVLSNCDESDPAMQGEIFGPVLPIVPIKDADQALSLIRKGEKPLAMYVFSNKSSVVDQMMSNTSSGSLVGNDCLVQGVLPTMPFGGVGHSGTGAYHGKFSFDTFSHRRAVVLKNFGLEGVNKIRYPPYTADKLKWLNRLMSKKLGKSPMAKVFPFLVLSVIAAILFKMFMN